MSSLTLRVAALGLLAVMLFGCADSAPTGGDAMTKEQRLQFAMKKIANDPKASDQARGFAAGALQQVKNDEDVQTNFSDGK